MSDLEPVTIADTAPTPPAAPSPPAPTALEQLVAPREISLKALRKLTTEGAPAAPAALAPAAPPALSTLPATRERDGQGRFVAAPSAAGLPPAPVVPVEDDTKPPENKEQFEKRLSKLTFKLRETERRTQTEIDRLTRELTDARADRPPRQTAPVAPKADAFPSFEDWVTDHAAADGAPANATYEDYLDARAEHRVEQRFTAERARSDAASADHAVHQALHHLSTQGPARHADFGALEQAAFDAGVRWNPHITDFVLRETGSAEEAIDLTYALLKDAALVDRLNRLAPARAWFELGKLTLSSPSAAAPSGPVATVPVTSAPAPIQPAGMSAGASSPTLESLVKGKEISLKRFRQAQGR